MTDKPSTTRQAKDQSKNNNPTGIGGFRYNPQNRSNGKWNKNDSYTYQLNMMDRLTVKEFKEWINKHPEEIRTMAQEKAYNAQIKARKDLAYLKEVTDRTEGRAPQTIDQNNTGELTIRIKSFEE